MALATTTGQPWGALLNLEAVRHLVRQGLGCQCPEEVFEDVVVGRPTVFAEADPNSTVQLLVGRRLLVSLVEVGSLRDLHTDTERLLVRGRQVRDGYHLNRFRLVLTEIKEVFEQAVNKGDTRRGSDIEQRLAAATRERDNLVHAIAKETISEQEAQQELKRVRQEIEAMEIEKSDQDVPPEQMAVLDKFEGINLASYSLEEKRELLTIVVEDVKLRFDRLFITYNLYEAPGTLFTGRVNIERRTAHNSKLRK